MTQPQPQPGQPPAQPKPPAPAPPTAAPPHSPLVDRVASLEDALTELISRYNSFTDDVVTELGL